MVKTNTIINNKNKYKYKMGRRDTCPVWQHVANSSKTLIVKKMLYFSLCSSSPTTKTESVPKNTPTICAPVSLLIFTAEKVDF